jgi:hypothetical protein
MMCVLFLAQVTVIVFKYAVIGIAKRVSITGANPNSMFSKLPDFFRFFSVSQPHTEPTFSVADWYELTLEQGLLCSEPWSVCPTGH